MSALTLTIVFDGKETKVSGPLNNKLLCYGLLECARDIIAEFTEADAKAADQRVVLAPGALPPGLIHP